MVRLALAAPYWSFWETSAVGHDLRSERRALLDDVASRLIARGFDVTCRTLLDSASPAGSSPAWLDGADLLVVVSTMAAPTSHTEPILRASPLPAVIWALNLGAGRAGDMLDIVRDGATVGTPQLTNVLLRASRPFSLVSGPLDDRTMDRVASGIAAELTASRFRGARVGRVGSPIDGYDCVDVDDGSLERALGCQVVRIPPERLRDAALGVGGDRLRSRESELTAAYGPASELDADSWESSIRLDLALRDLVTEERLAAGALNCHVGALRHGSELGVAPCLALGESTGRGVPWTCTGDVLTAVAMFVGRSLAGAALYHEIESLDPEDGAAVLANTGEHDPGWRRSGGRVELRQNPWFREDPRTGTIVWHALAPGPATLLAFTPTGAEPDGFRFITARGRVLDEVLEHSPTTGGAFRFATQSPHEVWERWVSSGANHHSALVPGDITHAVGIVAARLGVGHVVAC